MDAILTALAPHIVDIVFSVLGLLVTAYVVPLLKQKKIYGYVQKFVQGAEKFVASHPETNKKDWVVSQLSAIGIKVTPVIEAYIESAVEELDIAMSKLSTQEIVSDTTTPHAHTWLKCTNREMYIGTLMSVNPDADQSEISGCADCVDWKTHCVWICAECGTISLVDPALGA